MAKGNLLLGMGRGKLGDIVLYRQNGQQMSRPRTRVVKNPRTSGQQIQRMIQATIAYGYAGLKTIVDHSFEGVQYGQRSMSYFMKRNMDELRKDVITLSNGGNSNAHFAIPNVRTLYPNNYIVSNGSLAPCPNPIETLTGKDYCGFTFTAERIASGVTISKLLEFFNASAGEQLTFLFLNVAHYDAEVIATLNGEKLQAVALAVRRLKFKDSYTEKELSNVITDENISSLFDMSVTSSDMRVVNTEETGFGFYASSLNDTRWCIGGCVIRSVKSGQSWLRSPQSIVIIEGAVADYKGFTLSTAYNAWMEGTTPVGVSEYILNGKPNTNVWPTVPDEDEGEGGNP